MAESLAASGDFISNAVVEDFASPQEIPALGSECLNSASTPKTLPYSARIAAMMQNRKNYTDQVEFDIVTSKVHWSAVEDEDDENCVLDEEKHVALLKANKEAFEKLKMHPHWGPFFSRGRTRGDYLVEGLVGKKIAEGGQAEIYECPGYRGIEGLVFKVFKRGSLLQDLQQQWPQAIFDLKLLPREHVIRRGLLLDDGRFAFLMPKYWGDLRRFIDLKIEENKNLGPPFQFPVYLSLMNAVAHQMVALHEHGICHRDLKADNILVHENRDFAVRAPSNGGIQIADFECSVGVQGTTFWRAPEILLAERNWLSARRNGIDPPPIPFSKAADVYSYGMVLYEAWTGLLPFEREGFFDDPSEENYDRVIGGERPGLPDNMDWELKDLITKCWHGDEEQRPSFAEIRESLNRIYSRWINESPDHSKILGGFGGVTVLNFLITVKAGVFFLFTLGLCFRMWSKEWNESADGSCLRAQVCSGAAEVGE